MKSTKIKLNSRRLKVGDKIIRTEGAYSGEPLTVISKSKHHIKLSYPDRIFILPIATWNDDWVRYNLD